MSDVENKLYLRFHGRIIDSLGIQMYQSPVAAIAELIANGWDADANTVNVTLPDSLSGNAVIQVHDDGLGMTFEECQEFYLNVGRNRRLDEKSNTSLPKRPLLGRKGIGKFAGFGICELLEVDTTSKETGERTVFQLDLSDLRGSEYIDTELKEIPIILQEGRDQHRKEKHGTTVTLRNLTLQRTPSISRFVNSMARRFLINQVADEFKIKVNDLPLPDDNALRGIEFDFPNEYKDSEKPDNMTIEDGFGCETLGENRISWRIKFTKTPIDTEELRGISVFCGIKVAQTPFFLSIFPEDWRASTGSSIFPDR